MSPKQAVLARALSDGDDRLISADEALAALQMRCGGDLPGTIAVPALLEAVRKARRYQLKLARAITAQAGDESVTAWIEVEPRSDGEQGCEIVLRNWQGAALPPENLDATQVLRAGINRHLAELTAVLDARQTVLAVSAEAPDLQELAEAMRSGPGRDWTQFVEIDGNNRGQPMHWRLLDGATLRVGGSDRSWRASLFPRAAPGAAPDGFDLCLTSDEPLPEPVSEPEPDESEAQAGRRLIGRDVAPALRLPIARIIANAETIRTRLAGPLAAEYADYAADIAAAGQHLLALLDDLADLEVVEADEFTTAPDHIDLADVARRAAGILGVRAREKGIVVDPPRVGESLPAVAEFRRVLQILLNLLGNAIRYSPANSQVWMRIEAEGDRARVIVADQGPGLAADQQSRIFEKFERLGRSGDGGSGLGLYISRRLTRAMDGELSVESAPGQGARFILDLPADLKARAEQP
ncbi:MAG: sensor histidine kinase [Novosphingobium sp.]